MCRYVTTEEPIDFRNPQPSGLWSESSSEIQYVEDIEQKKRSRLSFRLEVCFGIHFFNCRNL